MIISNHNVSCIILAGGQGKRFNHQDKGLIELEGTPLIEHAVNRMRSQVNDIIISANRNLDRYAKYSSTVIKDDMNDYRGPLSGIASALPHCRHDWVIVIPCDMPFLPDNLVTQLAENIGNESIAVAKADDRLQLVFLLHCSVLSSIHKHLEQGQLKVMQWLQSHDHHVVVFNDKHRAFDNINTIQELSDLS